MSGCLAPVMGVLDARTAIAGLMSACCVLVPGVLATLPVSVVLLSPCLALLLTLESGLKQVGLLSFILGLKVLLPGALLQV